MTTVLAAAGLCPPGRPRPGWVAVDGGTIVDVGEGPPPRGARDLGGLVLAPGLIDLQVNGLGDIDLGTADQRGWREAGRALLGHGVTAYCPTLVSAPLDSYTDMLGRVGHARDAASAGDLPTIIGAHLEGPFLGGAPGAHPPELLHRADVGWVSSLLDAHPGLVRVVTLAPEADPGYALTRHLAATGVAVALGHSLASYDEARSGADAGATMVTHVFNGMGPLHHREPGLAGAALDDDRLVPTLIADLVHVHPAVIRLVLARTSRVALVSDSVAVVGEIDGTGGAARLADGTIVGATALLDRAVANVASLGVPVERAIALATEVPAALLGLADRGRITPGARADLVALDPATLAVRLVWFAGREQLPGDGAPSDGSTVEP